MTIPTRIMNHRGVTIISMSLQNQVILTTNKQMARRNMFHRLVVETKSFVVKN